MDRASVFLLRHCKGKWFRKFKLLGSYPLYWKILYTRVQLPSCRSRENWTIDYLDRDQITGDRVRWKVFDKGVSECLIGHT